MDSDEGAQKQRVLEYFDQVAPSYDTVGPRPFTRFGLRLVELAQIPEGATVLDVAAGRGAVLFPAAQKVGASGQVIGIDLAEAMVQELAADIARRGLKNVEVRQMDVEHLNFPDASFDVVLCGFALFFFPNLDRALSKIRRVMVPGARFAASTWGKYDKAWEWYPGLLDAYGLPQRRLWTSRLDTPHDLELVLDQTGFEDSKVISEDYELVYADEEQAWARVWTHGGCVDLSRVDSDTVKSFKADAIDKMRAFKQPDGIHAPSRVLYVFARKAEH